MKKIGEGQAQLCLPHAGRSQYDNQILHSIKIVYRIQTDGAATVSAFYIESFLIKFTILKSFIAIEVLINVYACGRFGKLIKINCLFGRIALTCGAYSSIKSFTGYNLL